jgi:putative ABC transport system permease protein
VFAGNPFDYFFLDTFFNRQYKNDQQFGQVFGFFALLAIFVASLGLFGLASFTAAQRTKEIGIRKVLGSTVPNIFVLLSKDFLKLVMAANVIAIPLVWILMREWLNTFAFRIEIAGWVFALAAIITTCIALLTVTYQSAKAAVANPVDSLRYE